MTSLALSLIAGPGVPRAGSERRWNQNGTYVERCSYPPAKTYWLGIHRLCNGVPERAQRFRTQTEALAWLDSYRQQ